VLSNQRFERAQCKEQNPESGPVPYVVDGFCPMRDKNKGRSPVVSRNVKASGTAGSVRNGIAKIRPISRPITWSNKLDRFKERSDVFGPKASAIVSSARTDLQLPADVMIEKIGGELLIILQYVAEQIVRRQSKICSCRPP